MKDDSSSDTQQVEEPGYRSLSSETTRDLTEEDRERLAKQDTVTDFKRNKLELEAQKNWDRFYHRNKDNFFKDRNWSSQDLKLICDDIDLTADLVFLEAGCGVGNMLFPLKAAYPNMRLQAFDFSSNAVQILKERAEQLEISVDTDVMDLSDGSIRSNFDTQADLVSLIFVMSAIHPSKHVIVAENMLKFVKIGGSVIVRDYGLNDHAMIRFGRGAKLGERFYARQDGTRAYYFDLDELVNLFVDKGFECRHREYLHRQTINHQKSLNVPRIFVQTRFVRIR